MKKLLAKIALLGLLSSPGVVWATNWYVDPAATGSHNGTSWANAWQSFSQISWGSIKGGDTLYLSGGTTSQTYRGPLTIAASGTSATSRITIMAGQDAGHTGTVIIDGGGVETNDGIDFINQNNLHISGNYNGQRTLKIQNCGAAISNYGNAGGSSGGFNVMIEYVEVVTCGEGFIVTQATPRGGVEISNNYIHDLQDNEGIWVISAAEAGAYNEILIHNNTIQPNYSDGTGHGPDAIQGSSGVSVYNNTIHGTVGTHTNVQHQDGIQAEGDYWQIYDNDISDTGNSCMYVDFFGGSAVVQHILIYNNICHLINIRVLSGYQRGIEIEDEDGGSYSDVHVVNNTVVDYSNYIGIHLINHGETSFTNVQFENNIAVNANIVIDNTASSIVVDYNDAQGGVQKPAGSTYTQAHGKSGTPDFVSYTAYSSSNDFHLQAADTVARENGTKFSTYFTTDKDGNPRPATGAWDIGAYEYTSQSLAPPMGLIAVVH